MGSHGYDALFPISWNQRIMRYEGQVFDFRLREQQPVKWVIVFFCVFRARECVYSEDMLVAKAQRNEPCFPAPFGEVRLVKGDVVWTPVML